MDGLGRFCSGGDYQLGWQEPFFTGKGVIGFMVKFYGIGNTVVQSEGYDMVKDPCIALGLFLKERLIMDWDFNSFNHFIYAKNIKALLQRKGVGR